MKATTKYICQECAYESAKWMGKCPNCGEWNSMVEEIVTKSSNNSKQNIVSDVQKPRKLSEITVTVADRIKTENSELDRVLGGGLVKGSMVLVGGDPGIGKSTLLLQICESLGKTEKVLYVSGEESSSQIKMRAERLKITSDNLLLMSEVNLDNIMFNADSVNPDVMIIDSIQTIYNPEVSSVPGSVGQIRETTHALMRLAKEKNIAIFIVGHVTKEGSLAGPKVLEHMVDCVLYFEGDRHQAYRILRTVKNRFGSTDEIGVFEMKSTGLECVKNPSEMLLAGRPNDATGSTVVCTIEGSRPVLAEVQALSTPTGFGNPRRMCTGIDFNRASMLIAVLEKKLGYTLSNQDIYINVVGGLKIVETATDLAVITAIASNYKNFIISPKTLILGEVGLTGEVRAVSYIDKRINEAKKLGFTKCIVPNDNLKELKGISDIEIIGVSSIKETINNIN